MPEKYSRNLRRQIVASDWLRKFFVGPALLIRKERHDDPPDCRIPFRNASPSVPRGMPVAPYAGEGAFLRFYHPLIRKITTRNSNKTTTDTVKPMTSTDPSA